MFLNIGVLKNFAIFTRKHLCWSLFLIQLQSTSPATILKRNSSIGIFLWTLPNFQEHLFWKTSANGCFWNLMKALFDHEILSFWTCYEEHMCILLSDCINTFVIRLKNRASMKLIILCDVSKKWEPQCKKRKASSWCWPYELGEGCSLLEINCSLWIYKGVSN